MPAKNYVVVKNDVDQVILGRWGLRAGAMLKNVEPEDAKKELDKGTICPDDAYVGLTYLPDAPKVEPVEPPPPPSLGPEPDVLKAEEPEDVKPAE